MEKEWREQTATRYSNNFAIALVNRAVWEVVRKHPASPRENYFFARFRIADMEMKLQIRRKFRKNTRRGAASAPACLLYSLCAVDASILRG